MKYIKKINKEKVEIFLGVKLKPNKIAIGFDVAQHVTGIAVIRTTDAYVVLEKIHTISVPKLPKKASTRQMLNGFDLFLAQLEDFKQEVSRKYKIDINRIENCFFGRNVKTLKALARSSILVYDRFKGISTDIDLILPTSARSKINFKKSGAGIKGPKLKAEIVDYVNRTLDIKLKYKQDNEADAIVIALSGLSEKI